MLNHLIDVVADRLEQLLELIDGGTVVNHLASFLCILDGS